MGRKTVRWKDLKDRQPGVFSCQKCGNHGTIQEYDYVYGTTSYSYCGCYYGKEAKDRDERKR